jgi:hypothetical protein
MSATEIILFKVVIAANLVALACGVLFGCFRGWRVGMGRIEGAIYHGLWWPTLTSGAILILAAIVYGVRFLVTA